MSVFDGQTRNQVRAAGHLKRNAIPIDQSNWLSDIFPMRAFISQGLIFLSIFTVVYKLGVLTQKLDI